MPLAGKKRLDVIQSGFLVVLRGLGLNNQLNVTLTFQEKRELQRLVIVQNQVIANDTASTVEKAEANRIKSEALLKLGVVPADPENRLSNF
ncbi:hypothetical protein AYM39_04110 [Methylomonas sp. DH-1]|nr:hypothetical protein AYM39_04110 [Methylomonas sp. DH-1]